MDNGPEISVGNRLEVRLLQFHRFIVKYCVVRDPFVRELSGCDRVVEDEVLGVLRCRIRLDVELNLVGPRSSPGRDEQFNLDMVVVGVPQWAIDPSSDSHEMVAGAAVRVMGLRYGRLGDRLLMVVG